LKAGKKGGKPPMKKKSLDDKLNDAYVSMKSKDKACPECGKKGCKGGCC
jgi:hypothetical protein